MNAAAITAVIQLVAGLAPLITKSEAVSQVIDLITQLLPVVIQEGMDLLQPIKNIIAAVTGSATTPEQLKALADLDAQVDAAFEAAAAAYIAAHPQA